MFAAFIANFIEAYGNPRASARRLLSRKPTMQDALAILALTAVLSQILAIGLSIVTGGDAGSVGSLIVAMVMLLIAFGVTTVLAYSIGARFGGKGSVREIAAVVAWHGLATMAMAPVTQLGLQGVETGQVGVMTLMMLVALGVSLWMFAAFIAEAHRFARIGPVLWVTLAVGFGIAMLFSVLLVAAINQGAPVQ